MKKILLTGLLFFGLTSLAQADYKFFAGVDGSYNIDRVSRGDQTYKTKPIQEGRGYSVWVNFGTESYFGSSKSAGLRWLAGISTGQSWNEKFPHIDFYNFNLLAGGDLLFDMLKFETDGALTFYIGAASGFNIYNSEKMTPRGSSGGGQVVMGASAIPVYARAGLSLRFGSGHNRLEVGAMIPIYSYDTDVQFSGASYSPYHFSAGYKILF